MKTYYFTVLLLGLWSVPASGLICWRCENARSLDDCLETGRKQVCHSNEKVCQTEVRYSIGWGSKPMIKTGCKQERACGNNQLQNSRGAWNPTQCNKGIFNSVCRCCCKGDQCNEQNLLCKKGERRHDTTEQTPKINHCTELSVPSNGKLNCTNGQFIESTCDFSCNPGYELDGSQTLTCLRYETKFHWTGIKPKCKKIPVCDPVVHPKYGSVKCDGSGEVGTNCTFYCDAGLKMEGSETTFCEKGSDGPIWTKKTPTCSEICPPTAKKDIVILIDSSRSINKKEWKTMINFLEKVIRNFTISKDAVQIAAFRFNGEVDNNSQVLFGNYTGADQLINNIRKIPKNGGGTDIGKALQHAHKVVLNSTEHNRPNVSDMIWVLTDGKSKDEVWNNTKSTAKVLREQYGVEILALGMQPNKPIDDFKNHLAEITGNEDMVIEVADNFSGLDEQLVRLVAGPICESSRS